MTREWVIWKVEKGKKKKKLKEKNTVKVIKEKARC